MKSLVKLCLVTVVIVAFLASGIAGAANIDLKRLLLYWSCDDGKGDTLKDGSGRGFNGTLKGNFNWVKGQVNGAVQLKTGYGEVKGNIIESTAKTGEITIVCWFFMNSHSQYDGIISIEAAGGGCCEYRIMVNPSNNAFWDSGRHADKSLANVKFDLNQWYHYALTADGKVNKIFVNGKVAGELADVFALPEFKDVTIYIGTGESPGTHPVEDTIIDEAMIWDKALTEQEMQTIMKPNFMAVASMGKLATTWANLKAE